MPKAFTRHSTATKLEAIQLAKAGMDLNEIAVKYNINRVTIYRWLKHTQHQLTSQDIPKIIALSEQGCTRVEIARKLDLAINDVDTIRQQLVAIDYIRGNSVTSLMDAYHIDFPAISRFIRKTGIKVLEDIQMTTLLHRLAPSPGSGHFKAYVPIAPELNEILDGHLLGDASLGLATRAIHEKNYEFPELPPLDKLTTAITFFKAIKLVPAIKILQQGNLKDLVTEFNTASQLFLQYPSGYFTIQKSILELRYIEFGLAKILEEYNYSYNLGVQFSKQLLLDFKTVRLI